MASTETDYDSLTKQCILWAETADTQADFEAFHALAETWKCICELEKCVCALEQEHSLAKPATRPADLMSQNSVTSR